MTEPRATRFDLSRCLPASALPPTELWMGGADTIVGEPLHPHHLRGAWVIDCAGDMPEAHRQSAARWLYRVFPDTEEIPAMYPRIVALARSLAHCLRRPAAVGATIGPRLDWEHPATPPARIYVLCKQGLNRSGLVMGCLLRELGVPGDAAHHLIRRHRAGSLNNVTFAELVRGPEPWTAP